ncbi:MAG: solanesyl pyrophosphate synthase [Benjaminiella poitrasii]|nr:MAG: solanesyl pyrophosphate synthase [Benjaminiella poitrasii]
MILSRGIRIAVKSTNAKFLIRPAAVSSYHESRILLKKAAELKEINESPFDKLAQGMNVIKSTILNAPPLRKVTRPNIESLPFTGQPDSWDSAIREAQGLVTSANQERILDPAKLLGKDVRELKGNITGLLGSGHPFIKTVGKHYFKNDTNRIRPLLVLLVAKATCQASKTPRANVNQEDKEIEKIEPTSLDSPISTTQRRLAEISEMIYTASLLHYDVIDNAEQAKRPGFGNKMAILAGDFLLARASLALSHLKNAECIELMATCIANLVEGEFMQLQDPQERNPDEKKAFNYYLEKIYMKTSSLIAQSCKASSVLAGCSSEVNQIAYTYGKHFGIALQLFDDVHDYTKSPSKIKNKLRSSEGITAPLLLAWEEFSELGPLIERQFKHEGDTEQAHMLVYKSSGLKKTLSLANEHIKLAVAAIEKLPPSNAQTALIQLAKNLPTRKN